MGVKTDNQIFAYTVPELTELSIIVEQGYSFSDPIKDEEQGWD